MTDALAAFAAFAASSAISHPAALAGLALAALATPLAKPAARGLARAKAERVRRRRLACILEEQSLSEWLGAGACHPMLSEIHDSLVAGRLGREAPDA